MNFLFAVAAALFVFLMSVTLVLFFVGPTLLLQPRRRTADFYRALGQPETPAVAGLPYEEINIVVDGTIKLSSWLVKASPPVRGTVIYLHGVADCKIDGLRLAKLLHEHHYNVSLYDARRHGLSDGKFCTYGYFEKGDVSSVINYLQSRADLNLGTVGLFGTSMGAAVGIQAAAIDKRITAVVAENSFATLRTIFDDYQRRMIRLPFHYLRNIVIKRSEHIAQFKANEVSPLEVVPEIQIPILFIYGTEDHLINHKYTLMLFERKKEPKELFPIAGAKHNNTWEVAGERYEKQLLEFLGKYVR